MLQPILVREVGDERFELIAGERRWRAAKRAGLPSIPVVVREVDEVLSLEQALVENLHREDLNPLEEAAAYQQLMEDFELTQEAVAQKVGKSRSAVANTLRLFQLPPTDPAARRREPAQRRARQGAARHARPGLPGRAGQADRGRGLSVREAEEAVRRHNEEVDADRPRPPSPSAPRRRPPAAAKRLRAAGPARARGAPGRRTSTPGSRSRWPGPTARARSSWSSAGLEDLERIYRAMTEGRPDGLNGPATHETLDVMSRVPGFNARLTLSTTCVERCGERLSGEDVAELFEELALALGADQALHRLAVLEHDERGDAHHVEAAGDVGVVVDVELGDLQLAGLLRRRSRRGSGRSSCTDRTTRPRSRRGRARRSRRSPRRRWCR